MAVAVLCAVAAGVAACSGGDDTGAGSGEAAADARRGDDRRVGAGRLRPGQHPGHRRRVDRRRRASPTWRRRGLSTACTGVSGTPAVVDGTVYVGDWTSHVRALDAATGRGAVGARSREQLRRRLRGGRRRPSSTSGTFDARIVALDRATGEPAWETDIDPTPRRSCSARRSWPTAWSSTGVGSFEVFVPSDPPTFRGTVVALDAETGAEVWRFYVTDQATPARAPACRCGRRRRSTASGASSTSGPARPTASRRRPAATACVALDLRHRRGGVAPPVHRGRRLDGRPAHRGSTPTWARCPTCSPSTAPTRSGSATRPGPTGRSTATRGEILWEAPLTAGGTPGRRDGLGRGGGRHRLRHLQRRQPGRRPRGPRRRHGRGGVAGRGRRPRHRAGHVGERRAVPRPTTRGASRPTTPPTAPACGPTRCRSPRPAAWRSSTARVYAGWGWWLAGVPDDADGGLIAFRPGGAAARRRRRRDEDGGLASAGDAPATTDLGRDRVPGALRRLPRRHRRGRQRARPWPGSPTGCTVDEHVAVVRDGRGSMPGWDGTLADEEIEAVVDYERTVLSGDAGG